jgi:hypothetical protein
VSESLKPVLEDVPKQKISSSLGAAFKTAGTFMTGSANGILFGNLVLNIFM